MLKRAVQRPEQIDWIRTFSLCLQQETRMDVWKKIKKLMEKNTDEELGTMDYDGFAKDVIDAMKGEV
jgi:hypothetical protein